MIRQERLQQISIWPAETSCSDALQTRPACKVRRHNIARMMTIIAEKKRGSA